MTATPAAILPPRDTARPAPASTRKPNTRTTRPNVQPPTRPIPTLLCERCGYDLSATPAHAPCAECGRPYHASHPDRRPGSPFQQAPSPVHFVTTTAAALVKPHGDRIRHREGSVFHRGLWSVITPEPNRSIIFAAATLTLAAALAWLILALATPAAALLQPKPAIGFIINAAAILGLLVSIESLGIQLMGIKNHWRITPPLAAAITAHAAPGWYTAAVLAPAGYLAGQLINTDFAFGSSNLVSIVFAKPPILLASLGFLAGLVHYETLVYLGVRACRYANPPEAAPLPNNTPNSTTDNTPAPAPAPELR